MDSKNKYCFTTIKSYTSIEQSRKLAEILPLESADMGWYYSRNPQAARNQMWLGTKAENADIPCWSLAALLGVLPDKTCVYKKTYKDGRIKYQGIAGGIKELILKDNPVDACYEMIIHLNELNLL